MPLFAKWLEEDIENSLKQGGLVPEDVQDSSKLPSLEARTFKSMYAYGFHFQVKSVEQSGKKTFDSGIAVVFQEPCRSRRRDQNVVNADLEYIGQIKEIVEVDCRRHCTLLLVCD